MAELAKRCDVLVALPGRLIDIMLRPHGLYLSRVRFTIIDEARSWNVETPTKMLITDIYSSLPPLARPCTSLRRNSNTEQDQEACYQIFDEARSLCYRRCQTFDGRRLDRIRRPMPPHRVFECPPALYAGCAASSPPLLQTIVLHRTPTRDRKSLSKDLHIMETPSRSETSMLA